LSIGRKNQNVALCSRGPLTVRELYYLSQTEVRYNEIVARRSREKKETPVFGREQKITFQNKALKGGVRCPLEAHWSMKNTKLLLMNKRSRSRLGGQKGLSNPQPC